jgi:ribosomal protein S18 acetylase RimI-like enzyme
LPEPFTVPDGFRLRPPTADDAAAVAEVMRAHEAAYATGPETTVEEVARSWRRLGFDLNRDAWIVAAGDERVVAYADVREMQTDHVEGDGYVHPAFEGRGLGTLLVELQEQRVTGSRSAGRGGWTLTSGVFANNGLAVRLFESRGYKPVRYFLREEVRFETAPPPAQWRNGFSVRTYRPEIDLEPVYWLVQEAFRDHWGEHEETLEQWRQRLESSTFDPTLWFIAESRGRMAGVCLCRRRDDAGHVSTLAVLRDFRRQGIAMALLQHAFGEFYARGIKTVDLGVDSENLTGAMRLYERAGMREVIRFALYRKEFKAER